LAGEPNSDDWWNGDPVAGIYRGGVTLNRYTTGLGSDQTKPGTFQVASMAARLAAVRSTGATNVVLVGGMIGAITSPTGSLIGIRPAGDLGCAWHSDSTQPHSDPNDATSVPAIQAAGFPVLLTESGDHDATGTVGPLHQRPAVLAGPPRRRLPAVDLGCLASRKTQGLGKVDLSVM
jgi:hypothetical protein